MEGLLSTGPTPSCFYCVTNILPVQAHNYKGDFPTFSSQFRSGCVAYGDFWAQMAGVWPHRGHPRVARTLSLELWDTKDIDDSICSKYLGEKD